MKKICCLFCQLNKVFGDLKPQNWFILVHKVHLCEQVVRLRRFLMNQMNLDAFSYCLRRRIQFEGFM
jgi:hypothetical protein